MRTYLLSRNQHGAMIRICFPHAFNGIVVCYSYKGGNEAISYNHYHFGIEYRGMVYDNVHPYPMPTGPWIADFDSSPHETPQVNRIQF